MQKIVFTLCSNNYLAHAKTLGDSLRATNPDVEFIIGLTDKLSPQIDYTFFEPFQIIPYDAIGVDFFEEMVHQYNIIEFNTSVKPFYFEYLFQKYGADSLVYYVDPDIAVYGSFEEMNNLLLTNNFLVTPHILKPLLEPSPFETVFLNVGVYNLGFIGMRHSETTTLFLKWWQRRLREFCYINFSKGLFVDQLWVNFIHLLFDKAYILPSPGYNMAYWNMYERKLFVSDGKYFVNTSDTPLVFFHFSGYDFSNNPLKCTKDKRSEFTLENRPDVADLFKQYGAWVKDNRYEQLSKVAPLLPFKPLKIKRTQRQRIGYFLERHTTKLIKRIFY
ncbi:hypothetical protein SAMN04488109_0905 [Chryseolinea serpens]|uniref:Glycosyl transferase family 8 n=2 Tax=Chryseolinea serpens TaxID=947013 RepID=A0A1M5KYT5_9BACT|nr:hypothetical protein SAMN04488109_0905 [Chryseolinea serpens]